jgi:hypothetical protein
MDEDSNTERRLGMKVTIGRWHGFLKLTRANDRDEICITIPISAGALQSERKAFEVLKDDLNMWPREDDAYDAVEQPTLDDQMKKTEGKQTMRYAS